MTGWRRARGEEGVALVTAVLVFAVASTLTIVLVTNALRTNQSSVVDRARTQALHVAEAGVNDAMREIEETGGVPASSLQGAVAEGGYDATITPLPGSRYQIDSTGTVGTTFQTQRRIRVTLSPPIALRYALFSLSSVDTKNNDFITGDVWANENVVVDENDIVDGSVVAANGSIRLENGSEVTGTLWSGSNDGDDAVRLENNVAVGGDVTASVNNPTDDFECGGADPDAYSVVADSGAVVSGGVTTWGTKEGPGLVLGPVQPGSCTPAPVPQEIPSFTYNPVNYDPAPIEFGTPDSPVANAVGQFQSLVTMEQSAFQGTYTVFDQDDVNQDNRLDLGGIKISGDTTIITNAPIDADGIDALDAGTEAVLTLVSFYQPPENSSCSVNHQSSECVIHIKNQFQVPENIAVILYAPFGPVSIKNNQAMHGTVYAENIQIKNNQVLTYDSRAELAAGFGDVTLEVESWVELPTGS